MSAVLVDDQLWELIQPLRRESTITLPTALLSWWDSA